MGENTDSRQLRDGEDILGWDEDRSRARARLRELERVLEAPETLGSAELVSDLTPFMGAGLRKHGFS